MTDEQIRELIFGRWPSQVNNKTNATTQTFHRHEIHSSEWCSEMVNKLFKFDIKNVVFNNPLTVVIWADGTKTFVKCAEGDVYDPEKALAMAISKKALGNKYSSTKVISDWVEKKGAKDKKNEPDEDYMFSSLEYDWCDSYDPCELTHKLYIRRKKVDR